MVNLSIGDGDSVVNASLLDQSFGRQAEGCPRWRRSFVIRVV